MKKKKIKEIQKAIEYQKKIVAFYLDFLYKENFKPEEYERYQNELKKEIEKLNKLKELLKLS